MRKSARIDTLRIGSDLSQLLDQALNLRLNPPINHYQREIPQLAQQRDVGVDVGLELGQVITDNDSI